MAMIRVPGVYFENKVREDRSIGLGETGVPAFLGVAERGPLNEPTRIKNMRQFEQIFGAPIPGSYLAAAVEGFFGNGGKTCFIVRIAHVFRRGKGELAKRARYEVLDRDGYPMMEVTAASEGAWGNEVVVDVKPPTEPRVQTYITLDVAADAQRATVQTTRGLEPGMMLVLRDNSESRYITLTHVRGSEIFWRGETGHHFKSSAPTYVEPVEFDLVVATRQRRETFPHLSISPTAHRNYLRVINSESELIRVRDLESNSAPPLNLPEKVEGVKLRGGRDGLEAISPDDFIGANSGPDARFGLGALEANDEIDLIAVPDLHYAARSCSGFKNERDIEAVHRAVIDHCERMGDRFGLLDLPPETDFKGAEAWRRKFDTAFAAIYYPWLVAAERGERKIVPPIGHVAGLISRLDREEGVHRAPANEPLEGVVDTSVILREEHLAELNNKGINCIRSFPVRGIRPWGARTLSSDPAWRFLTTRRVFNAVRRAIYENTQWVVFETNGDTLRRSVKTVLDEFLRQLWSAGWFKGDTQEQAFFVQCDEQNNTSETMDSGRIIIDIGLAPSRPTEFLVLSLEHTVEDRRLGDMGGDE